MTADDRPRAGTGRRVHLTLDHDAGAPSHLRAVLRAVAPGWGLRASVLERALLLGSELATNAVLHGAEPVTATISSDNGLLRIAVHDADPRHPAHRAPAPGSAGGAGLHLFDATAHAWGVDDEARGKTVWCILLSP